MGILVPRQRNLLRLQLQPVCLVIVPICCPAYPSPALRFVGALDLHEGALVANYPWDGYKDGNTLLWNKANPSPDDVTFVHLAKRFASLHKTMSLSKVGND